MFHPSVRYAHGAASTLAVCLLLSCLPTHAQTAGVPAVPPGQQSAAAANGKIVLPERSEVRLRLGNDLKSGANKTGEEVPFTVANDVYGPGHVLMIMQGAAAYGKVTQSSRRGMFGKAGKLSFTCDYILAPDGTHIPLRSDPMGESGHSNTGAMVATALLLSVAGVFINGKDVTIHKGQEFTMYVNENTSLTPPLAAGAAPLPAAPPAAAPAAAAPGKSLFTLKTGEQVVGTMTAFDGVTYTVATDGGEKKLSAAAVKSIYALK